MKTLVSALLMAGTVMSATAKNKTVNTENPQLPIHMIALAEEGEPKSSPEYAVQTYIENFNERDFEEMRKVISRDFTNQGLNRDGSLTAVQRLDDLRVMMDGQEVVAPESQNNQITITEVNGDVATAELITGPEGQRWKEVITLVKDGDSWKIDKIFWTFL
ncbi:MAG: nuclear transport factor 2 family protein [Croceimicrobium sp.]